MSFLNLFKLSYHAEIRSWYDHIIENIDMAKDSNLISFREYCNLVQATTEARNLCLEQNTKEALDKMVSLSANFKTKFIEMTRGK